jgi:hypothetical protein
MEEGSIKTIVPTDCPHCKKQLFVEFVMTPTRVTEVFTPEEMKSAKEEVLKKIGDMELEQSRKEDVISWVKDIKTIFGPAEIPLIIKSLLDDKGQ